MQEKSNSRMSASYTNNKPVLKRRSSKLAKNKENTSQAKNYTGLNQTTTPSVIQRKKKKSMLSDHNITSSLYVKLKNNSLFVKSPDVKKVYKTKNDYSHSK